MALRMDPVEREKILWDAYPNQQLSVGNELTSLWQRLKTEVPEGVLQLHYEMTQIEKEAEDQLPSLEKTKALFDKLIATLSPFFFEAGIPLNALPTSDTCTQLQQMLQQKWEDEALLSIWTKGQLRKHLKRTWETNPGSGFAVAGVIAAEKL